MQPQLTTKNGSIIPLTDEIYEAVLQVVKNQNGSIEQSHSIDELEGEFKELFVDAVATEELLAEHKDELSREEGKMRHFD